MTLPYRFLSFCTVLLLLIPAAGTLAGPDPDGIIYVKKNAAGSGCSWADALGNVADALQMAKTLNSVSPGTVKQIWVAKGVYTPAHNAADIPTADIRDNAFVMVKDVRLYGGFSGDGTEDDITDRDLADPGSETILSGDLEGNDGPDFANNSDNAYHVVISAGDAGQAGLDGFTIEGGNADGENNIMVNGQSLLRHWAGGIFINGYASLILDNLVVRRNSAGSTGGGIALYMYSSARMTDVSVTGNKAGSGGGGITSITNTTLELSNVAITDNQVGGGDGGGVFLYSGRSAKLRSVIISGNTSSRFGGGIYNNSHYMELTDVLVTGNNSNQGGGVFIVSPNTGKLTNVTISGNTATDNGAEWYRDYNASCVVRNSIIWGNGVSGQLSDTRYSLVQDQTEADNPDYYLPVNQNLPPGTDPLFTGSYRLSTLSPAVDAGSNDDYGAPAGAEDLAGKPRLSGAAIDMGAYEFQEGELPVKLVFFKARGQENTVWLSWQTTGEVNASHFDVQRSADARTWQTLGTVAAKGSGGYTFTDDLLFSTFNRTDGRSQLSTFHFQLSTAAAAAFNYYRLKMTDFDGTYAYSEICSVSLKNFENTAPRDKLHPNPAAKGTVILETADGREVPAIRIFDGLGREVPVGITGRSGKYYMETSDLPSGMYHVQVQGVSRQRVLKLLIE